MTVPPADQELYDRYGESFYELERRRLESALQQNNELNGDASQELKKSLDLAPTKYAANTAFGGLFFVVITTRVTSSDPQILFNLWGGGAAVGAAISWGSIWLNYPVEEIIGWQVSAQFNISPAYTQLTYWGMKSEFIGVFVGGGISVAGGAGGAGGRVERA